MLLLSGSDPRIQATLARACAEAAGEVYEAWRLGQPSMPMS